MVVFSGWGVIDRREIQGSLSGHGDVVILLQVRDQHVRLFHKGAWSQYFRLCGPESLGHSDSTLPL